MTKKEFIAKYEGWFSYTRREELKKEMETDLELVSQALRIHDVIGQSEQLNAFVDFYNSRKLSHERINYDEIDIFLESI